MSKTYLGDGVYLERDRNVGQWILTTEDGFSITNTIYLDTDVTAALVAALTPPKRSANGFPLHNTRCKICGRTWYSDGMRRITETTRCMACGATKNDWDRAPDGIDFRSQHTEKGKPKDA